MPDSFEIKFSDRFYREKDVREAAKAFGDIAKFSVRASAGGCVASVSGIGGYSREEIEGEFCNYVFHLGKVGRAPARG
jgi:hypothetical protein